jgi:hypothetical protein
MSALALFLLSGPQAAARTPSADNVDGTARNLLNRAGFTSGCIDRFLIRKALSGRHVQFGSYLGGSLLGALYRDGTAVQSVVAAYMNEGGQGRIHEFNSKGKFVVRKVQYTSRDCGLVAVGLKNLFDGFSHLVLTPFEKDPRAIVAPEADSEDFLDPT